MSYIEPMLGLYYHLGRLITIPVFASNFGIGLYTTKDIIINKEVKLELNVIPVATYAILGTVKGVVAGIMLPTAPYFIYKYGIKDTAAKTLVPFYNKPINFTNGISVYYKEPYCIKFVKKN